MIITQEVLEAGRSSRGSWSNRQLAALGVPEVQTTHCNPGWRKKLLGQDVPKENIDRFLSLKDAHLKGKAKYKHLFQKINKMSFFIVDENVNQHGTEKYNCTTCFHYKNRHCDGLADLKKVCNYWYSPDSEVIGLKYGQQS